MKITIAQSITFFSLLCLLSVSIQTIAIDAPEQTTITEEQPKKPQEETTSQEIVIQPVIAPRPKLVCEFESSKEFMQAFLDTSKKPEKSFVWWAAQLILLCQKDPRLKKFTILLGQAAKGNPDEPKVNRANAVSKLFVQYQLQFDQELQNYILKTGLQKVLTAMKKRAEK